MYITVYKMDKESAGKTVRPLDLSDGNAVHQWITGRLHQDRKTGKILYCVKKEEYAIYLYVQSEDPLLTAENRGLVFIKRFNVEDSLENVQEGDPIVFDTLVSPQHEVNNRRVYISDGNKRDAWVQRKLEEGGLYCMQLEEDYKNNIRFVKAGRSVRIPCSQYTGLGVITDKAKFLSMLAEGIGRNKCYGAGMLFTMPVEL